MKLARIIIPLAAIAAITWFLTAGHRKAPTASGLWSTYDEVLRHARYVDLTHTLTPSIPVWSGFGPSQFGPTINPATGQPYQYAADGFEATRYVAICPPDWRYGVAVGEVPEAPLPKSDKLLQWDDAKGVRVRR